VHWQATATRRLLLHACAAALVGGLAGCADRSGELAVGDSYRGQLYAEGNTGAAGEVVQCSTRVRGGTSGHSPYAEGATADTLEGAWDNARSEWILDGASTGYEVAAKDDTRVLYVYNVDGEPKQAVVMRNGPATEGAGGPGWYVESWARCDLSEFPDEIAAANFGQLIWTNADGERVPTGRIVSAPGPEHCGWQDMTFLHLGEEAVYVRRPDPSLHTYFAEPYDPRRPLPHSAVDTGYQRAGDHLWVSPDRQRAYVGNRHTVELWPRTVKPLGCD
jgi:hypothetical protein